QYLRLQSGGQTWDVYISMGALGVTQNQPPSGPLDATPPGGPYTWWRLGDVSGQARAVTLSGGKTLTASPTAPAGPGTATPTAMRGTGGALWHFGITSSGSVGYNNHPGLDFAQAPTCLIVNDQAGHRWFWSIDPESQELVVSDVLDPQAMIPWQSQG